MATDVEIERALHVVTASLNDPELTVDDGGGLHDETGARVGAIRQTDSGEWITERQNDAAERSDTAIPSKPPESTLGKLKSKLPGS